MAAPAARRFPAWKTAQGGGRTPLLLSLALHAALFILFLLPSGFLLTDRQFPEVQTINLFTAEEADVGQQAPAPKPAPTVKRPAPRRAEPPPARRVKSIAIDQETARPKPGKIVSLHPRRLKRKVRKRAEKTAASPRVSPEEKRRLEALERIEARVRRQREEAKIKHDLAKIRQALHGGQAAPRGETRAPDKAAGAKIGEKRGGGGQASGTAMMDEAMKRYFIAISRRIHDHWALPETQQWEADLEAIVVIVIRRDGTIAKTFFEKRSKNRYFDQYVEKTIRAAAPLPPLPADLKKGRIEIGLRFRKGGLI